MRQVTKLARSLGYETRVGYHGLRLGKDYAATFHRSTWKGETCYYVRWSAIEYIFTQVDS